MINLYNPYDYSFNFIRLLDLNIRRVQMLIEAIDRDAEVYLGEELLLQYLTPSTKQRVKEELSDILKAKLLERENFIGNK